MNAIKTTFIMMAVLFLAACDFRNTADIIASKRNSVVAIMAEKNAESDNKEGKSGLGTGWFLKDNYIVTNYHVAGNAKLLKVGMKEDEKLYDAEFVYGDDFADVAVIRIVNWEEFKERYNPKTLKFAAKKDIHIAEEVYAIGHPWGLFWSVSRGIISSDLRRTDESPNFMLQTDTAIYNGNSGGPLLNDNGDVVGMNDQIIVNTGGSYGMAIPAPIIEKVLVDLEKYKEVRWSAMGVRLTEDCIVKEVASDKPAEKAGILAGDKIIMFENNGVLVNIESTNQLITEIGLTDSGNDFTIYVVRDNVVQKFTVSPIYNLGEVFAKKENK